MGTQLESSMAPSGKGFTSIRVKKKRVGKTGRVREVEGGRNKTVPFKAAELSLPVLLDFILRLHKKPAVNLLPS